MREYLPLVFEFGLAAVVIAWGVRELIVLNREKKKDAEKAEAVKTSQGDPSPDAASSSSDPRSSS